MIFILFGPRLVHITFLFALPIFYIDTKTSCET